MNRRNFLKVAGTSVVGAFGYALFGSAFVSATDTKAAAISGSNTVTAVQDRHLASFRYGGRQAELAEVRGMERLRINGRELPHHYFMRTQKGYASHLYPFSDFNSADDLVKKLIDGDEVFYRL